MSWRNTEQAAIRKLQTAFNSVHPGQYEVMQLGGFNSLNPDWQVVETSTGSVICKGETKLLPSVAGLQIVVRHDPNEGLVLNNDTVEGLTVSTVDRVLALGDKYYASAPNQTVDLVGVEARIVFEAFTQKYASSNVGVFVGFHEGNMIAFKPTVEEFTKHVTPRVTVRHKKSGSSRMPASVFEQVDSYLSQHGVLLTRASGKTFIPENVEADRVNSLIAGLGLNLWVNTAGEVRKLSNTNNLNILFSFKAKTGVDNVFNITDENLVKLILSV